MSKIDPASPYFALTVALYKIDEYLDHELPLFARLKHRFWGHEGIILRSYDIRKKIGPFSICADPVKETELRHRLCEVVIGSRATIVSSVINKPAHKLRYVAPTDPYEMSIGFLLERIHRHVGGKCHLVFESRGKKEDLTVRVWCEAICDGRNALHKKFDFSIAFAAKKDNVVGLQLADLACRPILHFVEKGANVRPDWLAVKSRLRASATGKIEGWGLKVFP